MFKNVLYAFFIIIVLTACAGLPSPTPTPSAGQMDLEEQAVYAALLQKLYSAPSYVIMNTTATDPGGVSNTASILDRMVQNMPALASKTADSFRVRNDSVYPVRPDMDLGSTYALLSQAQMRQMFSQNRDGWQVFYEQYPQAPGITTLSRVGFNDTLDQALVYIGTLSNYLAGTGYYVLLTKVNGTWIVDQQVMTWIS